MLAWLLWPASLVFRLTVFTRRILYKLHLFKSHRAGVPVIVVGNLVVGGSGKTPLVLWIAELLKSNGWTPGIVSRGYGARLEAPREATIASDPAELGDEPVVLARRSGCTVWVGPDRVRVCEVLRDQHPEVDVILLDDGLQHYRLARDLEVCVVDARGFGNGFMLPAGPLREPRSRLRSVDAVVAHDSDVVRGYAMRLEGKLLHCLADARQRRAPKDFAGQRVHAVAGIGDPRRFFIHLERLGMKVVPHPFPDHHAFAPGDLEFGDEDAVIMTEKDAVKCKRFAKPHHWVFPVHAKLDPAFGNWLQEKLRERRR
jgi:tetraacyldisaccharide 4'-kinase